MSAPVSSATLVRRLKRFVSDAKKGGFMVVADADNISIRIIASGADADPLSDLRSLGEAVTVHGACGGGMHQASMSGNG
jgi:hypothetical protein